MGLSKNLSQDDGIEEPYWGPTMIEQLPAKCRESNHDNPIRNRITPPPLLPSSMLHLKAELRETKRNNLRC